MKTGYFAKLRTYTNAGLVPVSIARVTPKWYNGLVYQRLSPTPAILHEYRAGQLQGDTDRFTAVFRRCVLSHLDRDAVLRELERLTGVSRDDIILLCYEKPTDFCHRHLVAEWLGDCEEYV